MRHVIVALIMLLGSFPLLASAQETTTTSHAIALHGQPKYGPDFKHLDYVNPDAPKGGTLNLSAIGTFDSLNPFIVKGTPAAGLNALRSGFVYESLMQNSWDEPFSLYGILAESIELPEDKSWVAFNLRPEAKWSDGQPVTAADVVWTFNTLMQEGQPFFKAYWHDVKEAIAENEKRVRFNFNVSGNAELPLIVAEMAILPKHYWEGRTFSDGSLDPPLGSGPYMVSRVDPGRTIEYMRNKDWWGKDLPFFQGFYNFDHISYDYYRDTNVALEAFFAGNFDVQIENVAKQWETSYFAPPVEDGRIIKEEIPHKRPAGMQAFIYNTRRPVFQDIAVREALAYAFDFEWSNKQFAYNDYIRTRSFFENSELAATGLPKGKELEILNRYRDKLPLDVFTQIYTPPISDASGDMRENLKTAEQILSSAGWKLDWNGVRVKDGVRLEFEILDSNPMFERWVQPFIRHLKRLGVKATFRVVDTAQYQNRINTFDFDMTIGSFGQSDSPGNEQRDFWSSAKADIEGSRNLIGVKDPIVDDIIEQLVQAESREDLVAYCRALDRILQWNYYVIPMWHYNKWRIAYWKKLKRPETLSGISPLISSTWWIEEKGNSK